MSERLVGELKLAGVPAAVPVARGWIRETLGEGHPRIDDIELLTSETASNAILHSESRRDGGTVTLAVLVGARAVRLEVTDDGSPCSSPHMVDTPYAETGRGMVLVDALADAYGTRHAPDGTATFWFEVEVEAGSGGSA